MPKYERDLVTINDVAREAGVSITTVSRVLNNNYPVKYETREKIEKAIEKLQYNPNIIARGLIMKKTSVIGVVVPGLTNLFFPTIVEAIDSVVKIRDYSISLNTSSGSPKIERELVNKMLSMQVDGIILIDPSTENLDNGFYERISSKLPIIVINANSKRENLNFVSYNEEIGTLEAFEYLVSLRHRKIAFLRGNKSFSYDIKEKVYFDIIENNNLDYKEVIRINNSNTIDAITETEQIMKEVLESNKRPTAIFACNDLMAIGVVGACNNLGIEIPSSLSIIGFDNTLLSQISNPKLTTVDLNMGLIGKRAAEEILSLIEHGLQRRIKVVLETNLLVRESCSQAKK